MKRILFTWMLALVAGSATLFARTMTDDGHQLTSLWKQYEEAHKADLPKKEADILAQIKTEAIARHLPVDFYDAATNYVSTVQRRDWKQRDALREALEKEVNAFNEPIVTFLYKADFLNASSNALWTYLQAHPDGFQGCNPALHRGVDGILNGSLKPFIRNDKEYALWYLLSRRYGVGDNVPQMLKEELSGVYPNEAVLAYYQLRQQNWPVYKREQERKAYQELADQYAGKPFSIYPRGDLLRIRYGELTEKKSSKGSQYEVLYADALALEKERKACKGDAKTLLAGCTYPQNLISSLTDKELWVNFAGKKVEVLLRNLESASVTLYADNKSIKTWKVKNPDNTFFVPDTVRLDLPVLADGEYTVEAKNGKISDTDEYMQYTLSLATRKDSRGRCVYVTDYETGVPLQSVTLHLRKNGNDVSKTTLKLDGFTPLPQVFVNRMSGSSASWEIYAESGQRRSRAIYVDSESGYSPRYYDDHERCNIYKDRGAYNPGDTLQFKAIVYKGDPSRGLEVIKGRKVKMVLHDSEDNVIETLNLVTNDWGAVSGSFVIPRGLRNGRFELEAIGLGYDWFPVDEFVLPNFDFSFDPTKELYLVGDEVPVSGKLQSYSGHNLTGARVRVKVVHYSSTVFDEELPVGDDNRFKVFFKATDSGYYQADVTITDATGETRSFGKGWYVGQTLNVNAIVADEADVNLYLAEEDGRSWNARPKCLITSRMLKVELQALDGSSNKVPLPVHYELTDVSGKLLASGDAAPGEQLSLELPADGAYLLKGTVSAKDGKGNTIKGEKTFRIFCIQPQNKALCKEIRRVFVSGPRTVAASEKITARVGTGEGDAYGVVTLYGENRQVLVHQIFHVKDGTLDNLSFAYKDSYPDAVKLQVFYFIHGEAVSYTREYRRAKDKYTLPLSFTRFQDKAYPDVEYGFSVKTAADAEVLVAAWDKSMDAIAVNDWPLVNMRDFSVENVYVSSACGVVGRGRDRGVYEFGAAPRMTGRALSKGNGEVMMAAVEDAAVDAEPAPFQMVEQKPSFGTIEAMDVREKFASALTFQPHLRPSADGTLDFSFRTSDKLSTYYVRVYAHDQKMRNALVQDEMVVSLPVKVSLLEPRYLYLGDVYQAAVTVSSVADEAVSGTLMLQAGSQLQQASVTVPAGKTVTKYFPVDVASVIPGLTGNLTLTAAFKAADFSDAVRVHVPVYFASQLLTEAHSAVLRSGMDREALLAQLRSRFVNVPGSQATLRDISILDMVREAIPSHVDPSGNDVLSLSEAWYVRLMAAKLNGCADAPSCHSEAPSCHSERSEESPAITDDELLQKILACRNADGGFGWFEGMHSNPVITAVMLERMAKLRDRGFDVPDVTSSVKYLDRVQFGTVQPYWCGWVSDEKYMHVRALYAQVPFTEKAVTEAAKKRFSAFTKDAKNYLVPSKSAGRGLQGQILAKARRLLTLRNLLEREGGLDLAKAWGIRLGTSSKLKSSLKADLASLLEYAVEHRDGGWYYPNAVMPWRGLLESEAYAHALLCDLLSAEAGDNTPSVKPGASSVKPGASSVKPGASSVILSASEGSNAAAIADGVRLWLMLQKETQKWDSEPEFIDAITAILDGSEAVLNTRVLALSATFEAPFQEIKAAGNGFTVERQFFRDGTVIRPGDPVNVGDKITVKYKIWNAENRSFVKVTAGREASLSPVQQLSGHIGYGFIVPYRSGFVWGFTPQGYRNVKASATEYFFDSYPEETTTLSEEFFVERAGSFVAPVTVIESLYAPHYRANSAARPALRSQAK